MKQLRTPHSILIALFALGASLACESTGRSDPSTDTETNWLEVCDSDEQCGDYSCECGVCTSRCESERDCTMAGAVCSLAGEADHDALCREATRSGGLCLDPNSMPNEDSDPGSSSEQGASSADATDTTASVGAQPSASSDEAAATDTTDADDSASDPVTEPGEPRARDSGMNDPSDDGTLGSPSDATEPFTLDDTETSASNPDGDSSDTDSDDTTQACAELDRAELLPGCCYGDSDCQQTQRCYAGDCSGENAVAGVCATPIPGVCFDDRDCPAEQRCNGGRHSVCNSEAADIPGVCEPSTERSGYLLWTRPAGAAGTGPAFELLEDGRLRLWQNTGAQSPHETSDWDFEVALTQGENDELVGLLSAVDYDDLPHLETQLECYPTLHFERPSGEVTLLEYTGADALLPEMQAVYDWFDAWLLANAPDVVGPSQFCTSSL